MATVALCLPVSAPFPVPALTCGLCSELNLVSFSQQLSFSGLIFRCVSARESGWPDGGVSRTTGTGQERVAAATSALSGHNVGLDHLHVTVKVHQEGTDRSAGPRSLAGKEGQMIKENPYIGAFQLLKAVGVICLHLLTSVYSPG
ncbi:hypothetical protein AV530_014462 [Patagioenas fasciata monilis]|uniref:Uncharacterized protein n=1 Tax=Patagioenas fasciata monilis TaxID=372326 RepID=A0A1V4KC07_PATFA|nr:hypothetical protein AV530_014462 [Patagioenas fasciata monilis]